MPIREYPEDMLPAQVAPPSRPTASKLAMHRDRAALMADALKGGGALAPDGGAVPLLMELADGMQAQVAEIEALAVERPG